MGKGISPQTYPLIASRAMASKLGAFGLFTDENDRVPVSKIRRRVLLSRQILIQDQARGCTSISGDPESQSLSLVTLGQRYIFDFSQACSLSYSSDIFGLIIF